MRRNESAATVEFQRTARFSYTCNACGLCCRDKVITLSPYDLLRIARAAGLSTGEARDRYTIRRGSLLKFLAHGACVALDGARCALHEGRPLACRLYPLGLQRDADGRESFTRLDPASGSRGIYGESGTIDDYLVGQSIGHHLSANAAYGELLPLMRGSIAELVDFERTDPREFRRVAIREAMAESNYDPNPLIDALFDADRICPHPDPIAAAHIATLAAMIRAERDAATLAAAAVMLAVSLGFSPAEALISKD